jgi:hypothetical protein
MYPGDSWEVGAAFDSSAAVGRYAADLAAVRDGERRPLTCPSVPAESLYALADSMVRERLEGVNLGLTGMYVTASNLQRLWSRSKWKGLKAAPLAVARMLAGRMEPTYIFINDHQRSYSYALQAGLRPADLPREQCDIAMASDSLALSFRLAWGAETLYINGRFERLPNLRYYRFFTVFFVLRSANLGSPLTWNRFLRAATSKLPFARRLAARSR